MNFIHLSSYVAIVGVWATDFNHPMAKGGGDATPQQNGKSFLQTKFLPTGSSLGHLSMKKFFQIGPTVLALKLDKGRVLREWQPPLPLRKS